MNGRTEARIMSDLDETVDYSRKRAGDSVLRETPDTRFFGGLLAWRIALTYRKDILEAVAYRKGGS